MEALVTGYRRFTKAIYLTTAISKLDNSVLKNAAFSNAGQSLQGSVTGLRVVNKTGQPGSEPDIPFYVVVPLLQVIIVKHLS